MSGSYKIAVVGAGSIGGFLGATLARAGEDVTFVARGETLKALQRGLTMIDPAGERHAVTAGAAAIDDAGTFDLVILALKAQQIGAVAPHLGRLFKGDAPLLAVQNGLPWWYFQKSGDAFDGKRVESVDPGGRISAAIDPKRVIGGVIYVAASIVTPGTIHVTETNRMAIGEPDSSLSPRAARIAEMFTRAGFKTTASPTIRTEIWTKLWGNAVFNPISALTGAGLSDMATDPAVGTLVAAVMDETERVAARFGVRMPMSIPQRIALAASLGNHKTSMLQDIEAGRPPELEANVGAVVEFARLAGVDTPNLDTLYTCARLLAATVTRR